MRMAWGADGLEAVVLLRAELEIRGSTGGCDGAHEQAAATQRPSEAHVQFAASLTIPPFPAASPGRGPDAIRDCRK